MKKFLTALLFLSFTTLCHAATTNDIAELSQRWSQALSSQDPQKMIALYDKNAFLYATFANKISSQEGLKKYFEKLMTHKNLKVDFTKQNIRRYNETAINSGLYVFSYDDNGKTVKVPARYSFVYTYEPAPVGWLIVDHHSSVLPDEQ